MLKAVLIAASMAVAMPCFAQQVRVIKGDIEHVYGPGGQLLDDAGLQERNQRAWEHMQAENQTAIARRQVEIELGYLRLNTACASSDDLRLVRRFAKGGSGSSGVRV